MFFYKWTVNLKFLPEEVFTNPRVAFGLLLAHVFVMLAYLSFRYGRDPIETYSPPLCLHPNADFTPLSLFFVCLRVYSLAGYLILSVHLCCLPVCLRRSRIRTGSERRSGGLVGVFRRSLAGPVAAGKVRFLLQKRGQNRE